jgi:chemotaxis signal transduction protein
MLRAARQHEQVVSAKRSWNVVVFSVGGKKLAARTEDVGGVAPWIDPVPVPSRTPFVGAMLKREKDVMPVYDLGTRLSREPEGDPLLCLVARHVDGPMAICIDGVIPSLHNVDIAHIVPANAWISKRSEALPMRDRRSTSSRFNGWAVVARTTYGQNEQRKE